MRIHRLNVNARVVPVAVLPGGELAVPPDPIVLGWWSLSARPGDTFGTVVIDGHVDSHARGLGALFWLRNLDPGDTVDVGSTGGASFRYVVVGRREYTKASLPAAEIFQLTGSPRLVLITCGGKFNPRNRQYSDNVVVYAVPAPRGTRDV